MPEAQWDVRLASGLLREKAKGPRSPFFYYIQALPDDILAAVTLDDEDLEKVRNLTTKVDASPVMRCKWCKGARRDSGGSEVG
jgi:hypothetical protein